MKLLPYQNIEFRETCVPEPCKGTHVELNRRELSTRQKNCKNLPLNFKIFSWVGEKQCTHNILQGSFVPTY